MDNETFMKEVYEPFNETYRLIKMLKDAGPDDKESKKTWEDFRDGADEFSRKHDTEIGHTLTRMLLDIADHMARINGRKDDSG